MESYDDPAPLAAEASRALNFAAKYSYGCMNDDDHWRGEVLDNAAITAEYVFLRQSLGHDFGTDPDTPAVCKWLLSQQNPDGSWGIAENYPGDVSTTVETYFALKILQISIDDPAMVRGRLFARKMGGVAAVRMFTRFILATFGLIPWSAFPQIPPEIILLPTYFPFNVYNLSYWARATMVPMMVIRHHEPIYMLPEGGQAYLDELWIDPSKKNVPYYPSLGKSLCKADVITVAFAAVDKMVSFLGGLIRHFPLRSIALQQCIKWTLQHQEPEGDWAGITPPMYTGILALKEEGWTVRDPAIKLGLEAMERYATTDSAGKRIHSTVSPVWDTVLMTVALADSELADERLDRTVKWIKKNQYFGPNGDWRVNNPTLQPGAWCFQYINTWYPDTDDTAAAILALVKQDPQCVGSFSIHRATQWLLGLQNKDGGWGAFDRENDKLFLNKFPLGDMDQLCDPSSEDVTGRILECFGLQFSSPRSKNIDEDLLSRMKESASRAIGYLERTQTKAGSWYGRWGSNYIYGTSNALCALRYYRENDDPRVRRMVTRGVAWVKSVQNSDGGWGETLESYRDPEQAGVGPSTAAQTAWGVMALLAHLPPTDCHIQRGVSYLTSRQTKPDDGYPGASWPFPCHFTAVGFPLHFWLEYSLYRHYFPMMALGRFVRACRDLKPVNGKVLCENNR
ncbi:unnamed protein product [Calypogeia fissa]